MESEKRFEKLYSQASEAMENYDPIDPNVKIFEVIPVTKDFVTEEIGGMNDGMG